MFPTNDDLKAQLVQNGFTGDINTSLVRYLRNLYSISGWSYNDLLYYHLGQLGYTGSLNDRLRRWDGTLWSPLVLFQSSEVGVWYDPSDLSSMFQDSAGTTPATVGSVVGRINDKSGNGFNALQTTTASKPTLQQDSNGKYFLLFDGLDDFLVTSAINFTVTDKLSVFAGVRKLSDAAHGVIVELSTSYATNAGSFLHSASATYAGALGGYYRAGSRGDAVAAADQNAVTTNTYPAPITNVHAITHDIAGDSTAFRINGVLAVSAVGNKGLGTFGNYPLYIGRRAGTTVPLNGRIYSLVVRGAMSSASEIASAELFVNNKTGAY